MTIQMQEEQKCSSCFYMGTGQPAGKGETESTRIARRSLSGLSIRVVSRSIQEESPHFANGCDMIFEQIGIVCHRR